MNFNKTGKRLSKMWSEQSEVKIWMVFSMKNALENKKYSINLIFPHPFFASKANYLFLPDSYSHQSLPHCHKLYFFFHLKFSKYRYLHSNCICKSCTRQLLYYSRSNILFDSNFQTKIFHHSKSLYPGLSSLTFFS